MTSVTVAQQQPITELDEPAKRSDITGKVGAALDALVWLGLPRAEAAKHAGMTEHGLYKALRKPPVKAAYLALCEQLRLSGRARRIHRMEAVVEQSVNLNAAVAAYKALEMTDSEVARSSSGIAQTPGFLITIVNQAQPASPHSPALPSTSQQQTIEHQPIDNAKERG